jgi:hypothetical protein
VLCRSKQALRSSILQNIENFTNLLTLTPCLLCTAADISDVMVVDSLGKLSCGNGSSVSKNHLQLSAPVFRSLHVLTVRAAACFQVYHLLHLMRAISLTWPLLVLGAQALSKELQSQQVSVSLRRQPLAASDAVRAPWSRRTSHPLVHTIRGGEL